MKRDPLGTTALAIWITIWLAFFVYFAIAGAWHDPLFRLAYLWLYFCQRHRNPLLKRRAL